MTPEKRAELIKHLDGHGLSVIPTKDFDSILIQLARLAQFERLVMVDAENNMGLACVSEVRNSMQALGSSEQTRPMLLLDIPTLLSQVNRALHDSLDERAQLAPEAIQPALGAFVGILCRRAA